MPTDPPNAPPNAPRADASPSTGGGSFLPVEAQLEVILRGAEDVHVRAELTARLEESRASGRPLRVKVGFDPTRPDLHLGHAVLMQKMRQFQDLGHEVILLVGDFTAMVGDPTGQNDLRPRLTRADVEAAAETYTEQAFRILAREITVVRRNSEWLGALGATELIELMAKTTVSRMLERNDFAKRFAEQRPIYQHEFLYPLLQGYDSVALACDIELGGTDQLFNLLVGRDLMPKYGKRGQLVLTTPLLEGTDARFVDGKVVGKKMSKSADNTIGLLEAPLTFFRKVMQLDDDVIFRYYDLLSSRSSAEIAALRAERAAGRNPQEIKAAFASELLTRLQGEEAARDAAAEFRRVYSGDAIPDDVPELRLPTEGDTLWIAKALALANLVKSSGEGKRLVEQGGVEVNRERVTDPQLQLARGERYLLKVGSKNRRFAWVTVLGADAGPA
ncbi:MAG: tyrosine--tRNA ligase [Myxococcales bacterium]|nr:tyrosine--tRNA ligase [Myxococcales bacterium]MBL0197980.1 tyrosine--tRNA ligase [Myxococcales bacterium]